MEISEYELPTRFSLIRVWNDIGYDTETIITYSISDEREHCKRLRSDGYAAGKQVSGYTIHG